MDADQIDPATAWRIRTFIVDPIVSVFCVLGCRGVVVKEFARYYQGDTGLSGDIIVGRNLRMQVVLHSVPATYSNSFRVGTDVELKGHVTSKG